MAPPGSAAATASANGYLSAGGSVARCSRRQTVSRNCASPGPSGKVTDFGVGPRLDVGKTGPLEALGGLLG